MKTKQITALVAFVVTFAISVTLVSFFTIEQGSVVWRQESRTAQKISVLLAQDVNNGRYRDFNDNYTFSTLSYVNKSESMDDSELPRDFQMAWHKHMSAWRNQANLLQMRQSSDFSSSSFSRISSRNTNEINRTWYEVLRIAKGYGAEIPEGAY